ASFAFTGHGDTETRRLYELIGLCVSGETSGHMGLQAYLTLAAVIFCIGLFGVMTRRNTIGILLGIELMLNAVNINLVAFARFSADVTGMVFTVFTICITVAEAALGLAIVILLFRVRRTVIADHLDLLKG
ncbi:MAG TPA: NADH-quinone oxidoreductase subunit NuoK, partial [Vicinamibacterales bacterium]|nr:NADH-quinone oxidoreductase subunit NuoK [Vicinamibacterales bacterium]